MRIFLLGLTVEVFASDEISEDQIDDFNHLKDIISPEDLDKLNSLTHADKVYMMENLLNKMDVDNDEFLEPNEIHTWIHYVEQTRVWKDVQKHVSKI